MLISTNTLLPSVHIDLGKVQCMSDISNMICPGHFYPAHVYIAFYFSSQQASTDSIARLFSITLLRGVPKHLNDGKQNLHLHSSALCCMLLLWWQLTFSFFFPFQHWAQPQIMNWLFCQNQLPSWVPSPLPRKQLTLLWHAVSSHCTVYE